MPRPILPPIELVKPDTPLTLAVAAALAYPDGSMSAATLKALADNGKLTVERPGRTIYTTLRHIEEMREICRLMAKGHASGSDRHVGGRTAESLIPPHGTSETPADIAAARAAARTTFEVLSESLNGTSQRRGSKPRRV